MASFFKTATVQTGKVSGTHSNFPVYVDLSRVGVTTISEANSIRVYTDLAKTNEIAREIVSVSEMHCKVPTLSSTTTLYIDVDDVRSDYAVGATYGRNAVWSDYEFVFVTHNGGDTDSSGNRTTIKGGGVSAGSASSNIGSATDFNGTTHYILFGDIDVVDYTVQVWANADTWGQQDTMMCKPYSNLRSVGWLKYAGGADWPGVGVGQIINDGSGWKHGHETTLPSTGTWYLFHGTYDRSNVRFYQNGVEGDYSDTDTRTIQ